MNTTTNLHKFLPGSWGFSIPVKATYTRDQSLPRFGPNSDVELDPLEKQEQKSQRIKELYEISISKRSSKNWITRWSFDQMNFRLSQTRNRPCDFSRGCPVWPPNPGRRPSCVSCRQPPTIR